jgi:hypothetical protein
MEMANAGALSLHLDDLLLLSPKKLTTLYRAARVPRLADVSGDLRGRMLAVPSLWWPTSRIVRRFASSNVFPWRGKSFKPLSEERGEGINRVILDRWRLYRFTTSIGRSRAGEFDAVQLDYDLAENPFFMRPIKDEIRELAPGLYLGQAWLQTCLGTPLVLWFGLERP